MKIKRNPVDTNPFITDKDIVDDNVLLGTLGSRNVLVHGGQKLVGSFGQSREDIIPFLINMSFKGNMLPWVYALFVYKILKSPEVLNETHVQMSYSDAKEISARYTERRLYQPKFSENIGKLRELNFLADHPKSGSHYWFNPKIFFNGRL
jgi:hypothetical protein